MLINTLWINKKTVCRHKWLTPLSSELTWSTQRGPGQAGLHSKSQEEKGNKKIQYMYTMFYSAKENKIMSPNHLQKNG